jgi:phosphoesterase RecJ-like protein
MSDRMRRINRSVRSVVAETIGELKDPRVGFVTVTGVAVSPDLHDARVFVSVFGNQKRQRAALKGLESARGLLQLRIARELRMKRTPILTFAYDETVEHGVRLTKLIDELAPERPAMTPEPSAPSHDFDAVSAALRRHDRFLLATHENPDGDALGSTLAAALALRALDKDVLMYVGGAAPFPEEYAFLPLEEVLREPPDDLEQRVLLALDCANERRLGADASPLSRALSVINVDHHHDNARFGTLNLVVADASSTAEIVGDLIDELGVALEREIAEALYVGLVTDTGRFQYANTTAKALRFAAELAEAGANPNAIFKHVYETVALPKLKLLGLALERAELLADGRVLVSHLHRQDFNAVGAEEPYADGIIDVLRQTAGTEVVALMREPLVAPLGEHRVSLRSSSEEIDVSAIARGRGGGGHRQAAGFSSSESFAEIAAYIRDAFIDQADPVPADATAGS